MYLDERTRGQGQLSAKAGERTPRWTKSLFVKFFLALISLSLIPAALVAVFTAAAYQVVLRGYVAPEVVNELTQNLITQAILVFLFITVIALFVAFLLSQSITRPLRTLATAVERIVKGDLDLSFKITREDEIGALGHFFNDMVVQLKEVAERQKAINRVKSEFISITAHQLRTPLSAMKLSLGMFLDGDLGPVTKKEREMLERAYKENERMIRLVNDLLNVARIEEGKFGYSFAPLNVNSFLNRLVSNYALTAEHRHLTVSLNLPKTSYTIYADEEKLSIAIGNVIENALKYTPEGKHIDVTLSAQKRDFLLLKVKDEGVGISKENLKRIFTKFFRSQKVIQMETQGTGLGLFITKNIIRRHGGKAWLTSEEEKGTTFFITLPLRSELVPDKELSYEEFIEAF